MNVTRIYRREARLYERLAKLAIKRHDIPDAYWRLFRAAEHWGAAQSFQRAERTREWAESLAPPE